MKKRWIRSTTEANEKRKLAGAMTARQVLDRQTKTGGVAYDTINNSNTT